MNIFKKTLQIVFLLSIISLHFGCSKQENIGIDDNFCYEVKLIAKDCPSLAYVQVLNANIGSTWEFNSIRYENAITITNWPENLNNTNLAYLNLNAQDDAPDCRIEKPCQAIILFETTPNQLFCGKNFSTSNCNNQ